MKEGKTSKLGLDRQRFKDGFGSEFGEESNVGGGFTEEERDFGG